MLDGTQEALLREHASRNAMSTEEALELCDALPIVTTDMLTGRWRGTEIFTSHLLNGLLEILGWYGKEFIDKDSAHPLLFSDSHGHLFRSTLNVSQYPLCSSYPFHASSCCDEHC